MRIGLLNKVKREWEPGTIVRYKPKGIRGTIVVTKNGTIRYDYYRRKREIKMDELKNFLQKKRRS